MPSFLSYSVKTQQAVLQKGKRRLKRRYTRDHAGGKATRVCFSVDIARGSQQMERDGTDLKKALFQVSDGILGAAVLIALGVWGGNWLDSRLHTAPWLSLILCLLGGSFGLARLVGKAMSIDSESSKTRKDRRAALPETKDAVQPAADDSPGRQRAPFERFDEESN